MMRVAYDFQIFTLQEFGGISRYYSCLASALNGMDGVEARIFAPLHINAYLARQPVSVVSGFDVRRRRRSKKLFRLLNTVVSRTQMKLFRPDVVHETYFSSKTVAPKGTPLVVSVYDMIHERYAEMFPTKDRTSSLKREAVRRADHVICISHNTRNDLIAHFDTAPEKISVVHIGFEKLPMGPDLQPLTVSLGEKPYFLYVGQRSVYKNFINFIHAFAASSELSRDFNVVCFGGGAFRDDERHLFRELGLTDSQVFQVGGDDELLASCYRHAFAFVYPSLYEGFGIPPLEAMSLGCPVICSHSSSIPEVAAEAAEYFDPTSIDAIGASLERVAASPAYREELVRKGDERYRFFTWERCAEQTLAVYRGLT